MIFYIRFETAMDVVEISRKNEMRIHILKNYIKDLQLLLDDNVIDYSSLREKYLFQYSLVDKQEKRIKKKDCRSELYKLASKHTI